MNGLVHHINVVKQLVVVKEILSNNNKNFRRENNVLAITTINRNNDNVGYRQNTHTYTDTATYTDTGVEIGIGNGKV